MITLPSMLLLFTVLTASSEFVESVTNYTLDNFTDSNESSFIDYENTSSASNLMENITDQEPESLAFTVQDLREFRKKVVELSSMLGLKAVGILYEPNKDLESIFSEVLQSFWRIELPTCIFKTVEDLEKGVFPEHKRAFCFQKQIWTIVLLGNTKWAANLIDDAIRTNNIYDARIHWVVLIPGKQKGKLDLPSSKIYGLPLISWLYCLNKTEEWIVSRTALALDKVRIIRAGKWKNSRFQTQQALHPERPTNYFGLEFRIVSGRPSQKDYSKKSAVAICVKEPNKRTRCHGYVGEMLDIITSDLNLTIVNRKQSSCGNFGSNNTRLSLLVKQDAEMALGTCTITYNRLQAVDFSEWFRIVTSVVGARLPREIRSPFIVFEVFTGETWIILFGVIVGSGIFLLCISLFEIEASNRAARNSYAEPFVVLFKAFVFQSHNLSSKHNREKVFIGLVWFLAITIAAIYSGNLTAWLFKGRYEKPIDSVEDIAKREDMYAIVRRNDPNHQILMDATKGPLVILRKRLKFRKEVNQFSQKITEDTYAYINSRRSLYLIASNYNKDVLKLNRKGPCLLHLSREPFSLLYIGNMFQRNSYFLPQISRKISWLKEYGVMDKIYSKYNEPGCFRTRPQSTTSKSLNVYQMQGAFWLLITGLGLACLCFIVELLVKILENSLTKF